MATHVASSTRTPAPEMKELMDVLREPAPSAAGRVRTRPMVGGVLIALAASVATYALTAGAPGPTRTVPYSEKAVIKSEMLGVNGGVQAMAPANEGTSSAAAATGSGPAAVARQIVADEASLAEESFLRATRAPSDLPPAAAPPPVRAARAPRETTPPAPAAAGQEGEPACASCISNAEMARRAETVAVENVATVPPPPATVNVGSRLRFTLVDTITTGSVAAPVNARVVEDVVRDGRVVIPAGATLVGDAYATRTNDRAQIILSALVVNGRTIPLRGVVLGADGDLGLVGKVVRKGSKTKSGMGKVLGALGSGMQAVGSRLTFGVIPGGGLVGEGASELASEVGSDLARTGQVWAISDKGVRVPAGSAGLFHLQIDVVLP